MKILRQIQYVMAVIVFAVASPAVDARTMSARVDTAFTEDCEEMVVTAVGRARDQILLAIYTFSNWQIAEALVAAKDRGVEVVVKADKGQMDFDAAQRVFSLLKQHEIPVEAIEMQQRYHMHHKFMVIDREVVLTGSYNYTVAGSTVNYENLVLIVSQSITRRFIEEFETIEGR
jgi:phosphatidylserine/phosphatidylglycerophosphate/cardiolipin synthase-like enzyme